MGVWKYLEFRPSEVASGALKAFIVKNMIKNTPTKARYLEIFINLTIIITNTYNLMHTQSLNFNFENEIHNFPDTYVNIQ